jgi:PAS domain S-box-containing protein
MCLEHAAAAPPSPWEGLGPGLQLCPTPAFLEDGGGRVRAANPALRALLGYPARDGDGACPDLPTLWCVERERTEAIARARAATGPVAVEAHLRRGDGRPEPCRCSARLIGAGDEARMLCFVEDAAGAERAEMSDANLRALIENTDAIIASYDRDIRLLVVNQPCRDAYRALFGVTLTPGMCTLDLFPAEQQGFWRESNARALAGETFTVEFEVPGPDGAAHIFESSFNPIRRGGEVVGFSTFTRDVTARKQAERRLVEAEARARAERNRLEVTLRSIGDGVIATDTRGHVLLLNTVAERLTGVRQAEAAGRPLLDTFRIVDARTRAARENPVDRALATGRPVELESNTLLLGRDGAEHVIADSAAPICTEDGQTLGVVLVFRDVTERHRMLEAIERTSRLESLGVLAGGIAHDFNNLLASMYGLVELARDGRGLAEVYELLGEAVATIDRARGLTTQLLTFARGGAPVKRVEALLPVLRQTAQFALSGSSATARLEAPDELWPCDFDRGQIAQVIDNLVINAVQAMPQGGVITVRAANALLGEREVASLPAGRYLRIAVQDQGCGIAPELRARIFDPFFTTKLRGTGLGLATSHSIIARHGGAILVDSEVGQGSTFTFYLPAATTAPAAAPAPPRARAQGGGSILVMDDDASVLGVLGSMLDRLGFQAVKTRDGAEAVRVFEETCAAGRCPRAVILDLTVSGGLGGKEAGEAIRRLDPAVPILISSGYANDPIVADPGAYGFSGSLCKPYCLNDLRELLASSIGLTPPRPA